MLAPIATQKRAIRKRKVPAMPIMTIEAFRATRVRVADISVICADLDKHPGYIYVGRLYIEAYDGWLYLPLGSDDYFVEETSENLTTLEQHLYSYAKHDGAMEITDSSDGGESAPNPT